MSARDVALGLVKLAIAVFPPLIDLVKTGLDNAGDDDPLADDVEALLPADSASARARRKLEQKG